MTARSERRAVPPPVPATPDPGVPRTPGTLPAADPPRAGELPQAGGLPRADEIPEAGGLPWIGPLPALLHDGFGYLLRAQRRYGDIYRISVGGLRTVVLNHPRQLRHVYVDRAGVYEKRGPLFDQMRRVTGNGLAVSRGDIWTAQRRRIQPLFHHERLAAVARLLETVAAEQMPLFERAAARRGGGPVDLGPLLAHTTMKMTVRAVFGSGIPDSTVRRIGPDMTYIVRHLVLATLMSPLPRWAPRPGDRRFEAAIRRLDRLLHQVVADRRRAEHRRAEHRRGEHRGDGRQDSGDDLISLLTASEDETGARMTPRQVRDETMTLFLAGYETTALALTWAAHRLATHPASMARVGAEADRLPAPGEGWSLEPELLPYTGAVWDETLRLTPPIWWNPRWATEDDAIDGHPIPAGTSVAPLAFVAQRHPDVWERPHDFDPTRFLDAPGARRRPRGEWAPFGLGREHCIGRELANLEARIVLSALARRFHLVAPRGRRVRPVPLGTLRPSPGVRVHLEPRS
ncbi:cytochrome P450 [Streptomyces sp. NPDC000594]|uniref:cytochrome P450 n=1 Tax=Streptomyces sp. NPDC000594 TaxID=3154261 RepID=UPI003323E4A9